MTERTILRALLFVGMIIVNSSSNAFAHFLFMRIGGHAEAGRTVEVFFSEKAEAGDPRYTQRVAGTQLWMQSEPGQFVPLTTRLGTDRLRAFLPSEGAMTVTGVCEYGILEREVPFLLRYYPKSIAGPISDANRMKPSSKVPLEIMATIDGDSVTLTLLDHGKPVPQQVFTTCDDDLVNVELKADSDGNVTWKPPKASHYCIYTKVVRKQAGESAGKKYTEIREFPTISFHWPAERTDADPKAVELFEKALLMRANWRDFPGFAADINGQHDGRAFSGKVSVERDGKVAVQIDQDVATNWVEDQLRSITMHRLETSQTDKPILQFADQDTNNPMGRLLTFVGGRFASSYRVRDDQVMVVNRNFGAENMTITILENEKTPEGKFLPHLYNVQYWNAKDGSLVKTEAIENRWHRNGSFDLPAQNTVITSSSSGLSVRSMKLSNHELLKAK